MPESYTPRQFIDKINSDNPGGVKYDPYGTDALRRRVQEKNEGASILAEARETIAERKRPLTPEQKIAEVQEQIEAMREWLLADETYDDYEVDTIINGLTVEYDEDTQEAVVMGDLDLGALQSAIDLKLPQSIDGNLSLGVLQSAKDLKLPESIGGNLVLSSLKSAEDLTLPQSIGGDLSLRKLKSAKDLKLPQAIGGSLRLGGLTSTEDLELPQTIGGRLDLRRLQSAEGLKLPQSIGSFIFVEELTTAERNAIRAQRPDLADKILPED